MRPVLYLSSSLNSLVHDVGTSLTPIAHQTQMDDAETLLQRLVDVSSCLQETPWDAILENCDQYVSGNTASMETLDSLEVDKAELKQQLEDCKRQLQKAQAYANGLKSAVKNMFENVVLDEKRLNDMKKSIEKQNFRPMNDYLFSVEEYTQNLYTCIGQSIKINEDGVVLIAKLKAQVIGETTAGAELAGGATTGMVGAGTTSPTAASTAVAGAGVVVGAAMGINETAKQLEELASGLRQMHVEMKSIQTRLSRT